MIGDLITGSGFWNPIVFLIAFIILDIVAYIVWKMGNGDYIPEEDGGKPFLSGNPEISKEESHIKADNIYWGLKEALHGYYEKMENMHNGRANDYILWFIGVIAILLILMVR